MTGQQETPDHEVGGPGAASGGTSSVDEILGALKAYGVRVFMTGADENGEPRHRKRRGSGDWVPGTRQTNTLLAASAAMSFIDVDTGLLPDGTPKCVGAQESLDYLLELGLDDVWLYKAVSPSGGLHYGLPGFKLGEITGLLPGVDIKSLQRDLAPEDQQAFVWGPGTTRPHGRKVGGTYDVLELRLGDAEWQRPAFEAFMWELKTIADAKRTPEPTPAAGGTPQGPEGFKYALDGPPVREDQRRFLLGYALLLRDRGNDHDMRVEMLAIMQRRRVPNTNPADPWTMDHFNNIATMGAKVAAPLQAPSVGGEGWLDKNGVHRVAEAWNCQAGPSNPVDVVDAWLAYTGFLVRSWRQSFYRYSGGRYKPMEEGELQRILYNDLKWAYYERLNAVSGRMERVPYVPIMSKVNNFLAALRASPQVYRQDHWGLDRSVVFMNGRLDLATGELLPFDPQSFNMHKIAADYDPAALCPDWLAFIESSLPEQDQRDLLQEMLGYLLSGRTDLHKIFGLWGLKRTGKSTIGKVVEAILGGRSVTSTTYQSVIGPFGLASHAESSVIIINEARTTKENKAAVDLFKAISGEDSVDVNVKNKSAYSARLSARLVMLANDTPNAMDESDAYASRFMNIMFNVSFAANPDESLLGRLMLELPGIVAWSFRGLERLNAQGGRFTQSEAHRAAFRLQHVAGSPRAAWFEDRILITGDPKDYLPARSLWADWLAWCDANDVDSKHWGDENGLGRYLSSRLTGVSVPRKLGGQVMKVREGVTFR